jgi:hypothetical protein
MNRLQPNLEYEVKAQRPANFPQAYELALHYELLQAGRDKARNISIADLAEKIEALALAQSRPRSPEYQPSVKLCYYCKMPNHLIRNCRVRASDLRNGYLYGCSPTKRVYNGYNHKEGSKYYGQERERNYGGNSYRRQDDYDYNEYESPSHSREKGDFYGQEKNRSPPRERSEGRESPYIRVASPDQNYDFNGLKSPMKMSWKEKWSPLRFGKKRPLSEPMNGLSHKGENVEKIRAKRKVFYNTEYGQMDDPQ